VILTHRPPFENPLRRLQSRDSDGAVTNSYLAPQFIARVLIVLMRESISFAVKEIIELLLFLPVHPSFFLTVVSEKL
jgi:hypothetical protein